MKRKSKSAAPKLTSPDTLVSETTDKGDIELKEEDLQKVSGGLIALLNKQK
jgi:hypothetical protein